MREPVPRGLIAEITSLAEKKRRLNSVKRPTSIWNLRPVEVAALSMPK
jgi:hypothetical protein